MNYKTTLIIAAIAATAFAALGSALPVFETAYASNGGNGGNGNGGDGGNGNGGDGGFSNEQGDACIDAGGNNCAGNIAQSNSNFQQGVEQGDNNN
jgi:hypothetical protein